MAGQIIWSDSARKDLFEILSYWIERNQSSVYSKKLSSQFELTIDLLAKLKNIGQKTDYRRGKVRVFIFDHFKIFYLTESSSIEILRIFDTRRNPDSLTLT